MFCFRRYKEDERGVASIEAALILPLLVLIGFGIVDSSLLLMQNHKLSAGLVSAGNYLSQSDDPKALETKAKNLAISGQFRDDHEPHFDNLKGNSISILYRQIPNPELDGTRAYRGGDFINVIEIKGEAPFKGIGLLSSLSGGKLSLSARHEVRLIGVEI